MAVDPAIKVGARVTIGNVAHLGGQYGRLVGTEGTVNENQDDTSYIRVKTDVELDVENSGIHFRPHELTEVAA